MRFLSVDLRETPKQYAEIRRNTLSKTPIKNTLLRCCRLRVSYLLSVKSYCINSILNPASFPPKRFC